MLLIVLSSQLIGQSSGGNFDPRRLKNPTKLTGESIEAGQVVYQKNCRFCHGNEGKGDGSMAPKDVHPADLTDAKWDHGSSDGEIFAVIRDGIGPDFKMKGFRSRLTDADIWNVVNYIRSLGQK
jgi:mono/diheme cytochrome c family protein